MCLHVCVCVHAHAYVHVSVCVCGVICKIMFVFLALETALKFICLRSI